MNKTPQYVTVTKAKAQLPGLVAAVEQTGQEIVLTRHGRTVAILTCPGAIPSKLDMAFWAEELRQLHIRTGAT